MSMEAYRAVWKGTSQRGNALLMLLAIADCINHVSGVAWPSVSTLAKKTKMEPRNVHILLRKLEASGELSVNSGGGRRGTNLYSLGQKLLQGVQADAEGVQRDAGGMHCHAELQDDADEVHDSTQGGAPVCTPPLHAHAPESVLNHQESKRKRVKAALTPLPEAFEISPSVRAWAEERGFGAYLDAHFDQFTGYARAKASTYADWDQAFTNAIRGDWGDVRKKSSGSTLSSVSTTSPGVGAVAVEATRKLLDSMNRTPEELERSAVGRAAFLAKHRAVRSKVGQDAPAV